MNGVKLVGCVIMLWFSLVQAQVPYTEIKVGRQDPAATKPGYLFGIMLGRAIDESFSWGLEVNYFQRSYQRTVTVASQVTEDGNVIRTINKEVDFRTVIIPFLLKINYEHPLAPRSRLYLRSSAGLGWQFVWNSERNYLTGTNSTRFFNGFGWQGSVGVGLAVSSSGNLFVDLFYNNARPTRGNTKNEAGLPTWQEMDLTGFGIKIGLSFVGFGW